MKKKICGFIMKCVMTVAITSIFSCNPPLPESQIQIALENLLNKSPMDSSRLHEIPVPISWKIGNLNGATLAATVIYYDRVEIIFDWSEIKIKGEALEPIIAHEISHAYDAFHTYGLSEFFMLVNEERNLPWADRTVEKKAIEHENETRQYLIKNYPKEFKNLPPFRKTE